MTTRKKTAKTKTTTGSPKRQKSSQRPAKRSGATGGRNAPRSRSGGRPGSQKTPTQAKSGGKKTGAKKTAKSAPQTTPPETVAATTSAIRMPDELEWWSVDDLGPYERNPRTHDDAQITKIAASLLEFGWTNPILADPSGGVIAGHGRLLAAQMLGMETVPVIVLPHMTEEQRRAYVIADNQLALDAGWDTDLLSAELRSLSAAQFDLSVIGFDLPELRTYLDEPTTVEDEPPTRRQRQITKPGDLWVLGMHRVLCGDGTNDAHVARLLDGVSATMVFTDPPYNVDRRGSPTRERDAVLGDKQDGDHWTAFCDAIVAIIAAHCCGDVYIWGAPGPDGMHQRLRFVAGGLHWSSTIIWRKPHFVLSRGNYHNAHECCFYGWHESGESSFVGDRSQRDVWDVRSPRLSKLHPTMKPLALAELAFVNSSQEGDVVLDLFGGSGSTLIAAEQMRRPCCVMELDPAYCDVIVRRWQEETGESAILEASGTVFGKRRTKQRSC